MCIIISVENDKYSTLRLLWFKNGTGKPFMNICINVVCKGMDFILAYRMQYML